MRAKSVCNVMRCALVILTLCALLGTVSCTSLGEGRSVTTALLTTTEAPTTTSTTLAPVAVTDETSQSPCLIREAFTQDGTDYVVVDYIEVEWLPPDVYSGEAPRISNGNPKLRTFVVPASAMLRLDFEALAYAVECGDVNTVGEHTKWGFWDIRVANGYVTSLESGSGPWYVW